LFFNIGADGILELADCCTVSRESPFCQRRKKSVTEGAELCGGIDPQVLTIS
jgi:hypothetical protein